ncbi:hypothetical protein SAMN05216582_1186 [Selenomonas ruminantium]|uniref:Tat (Twin-arginine translocation) pathway signal sequence n=1 Tax=Selenomonas ruminantium TaxID=971 RepID=A0A1M6VDJ0_SELRU|nr:twin-arginine translocation signal domain-containing protein [Selenomonas ruminantium]SHK79415.1 hypothetical protein SAMN05216582_1186 [Selenomonas ruminantium]
MNRREFLKVSGMGAVTFFLTGCDKCGMDGPCIFKDAIENTLKQRTNYFCGKRKICLSVPMK